MEPQSQEHPTHCTFCELIQGSAEVSICHEDADAIAFMDIQPVNNGHVLVVPREHHESVLDVPEELGLHLFRITMRLANAIRHVTGCEDMNIVVNSGAAAGQDEPHYHVHIIPRREGDGFDIPLPFNGSRMPDRTILDAYAVQIIAALRDPMRVGGAAGVAVEAKSDSSTRVQPDAAPSGHAGSPTSRVSQPRRAARPPEMSVFSERSPNRPPDELGRAKRREDGDWKVEEGAHGELRYAPTLPPELPAAPAPAAVPKANDVA